ncbi:hypothetical protein ACSBR1_002358 [Camellia fascicularis]
MADDLSHDGAPFEIPPLAEMEIEPESEILPLGVRHFDPATYHPQIHVLPPGGIRRILALLADTGRELHIPIPRGRGSIYQSLPAGHAAPDCVYTTSVVLCWTCGCTAFSIPYTCICEYCQTVLAKLLHDIASDHSSAELSHVGLRDGATLGQYFVGILPGWARAKVARSNTKLHDGTDRPNTTFCVFLALPNTILRVGIARPIVQYKLPSQEASFTPIKKKTKIDSKSRNYSFIDNGGFGKVYKGVLPSSREQVAIKKISHNSKQGVTEFVANIASMERDVKAINVLLDAELNGRLGDFGLTRLYDHGANPETTHVVGTVGYLAPELIRTRKATASTDVFAFGAFMLEVACGRKPIVLQGLPEEIILVDWVHYPLQAIQSVPFSESKVQLLEAQLVGSDGEKQPSDGEVRAVT